MLLVFAILAILVSVSAVSAASDVYVATNGSDFNLGTEGSPFLTISQGVSSVDANGTVHIADGVYSGTGNVNITINKNMVITGQSQNGTVIDGASTARIFIIPSGKIVTIQNLTLLNGNAFVAGDNNGGAIDNDGTLNVTNCSFTGNTASNVGGAILNSMSGTLIVINSTFTGSSAFSGGVIYNVGTLNVTGSTFIGSHASAQGSVICSSMGNIHFNFNRVYGSGSPAFPIYNINAQIEVNSNWWGSNNPNFANLLRGVTYPVNWLYMTINATPSTTNSTRTSIITVSFNNLYNGTNLIELDPNLGHIQDMTPVTFSLVNGPYGNLTQPLTVNTTNGLANILFTASAMGTQTIRASTDGQNVNTNVIIPGADVVVTKEFVDVNGNPVSSANYLGTVYVRITLTNNGPYPAYGVFVNDTFSNYLSLLSGSQFSYDNGVTWVGYSMDNYSFFNGQYFTWDFIDGWNRSFPARPIGVGEIFIALIPVLNLGHANEVIYNTASVNNSLLEQFDPDLSNNVGTDSFVANDTVDIIVSKSVNNTTPNVGDVINYAITISNKGPDNAGNVIIHDFIPAGLDLNYGAITVTGIYNWFDFNSTNGLFRICFDYMPTDTSVTVNLPVTVSAALAGLHVNNTASLYSLDQYDRDSSNNESKVGIHVLAADLSVMKDVDDNLPVVGQMIMYTITALNNGPDNATGVTVLDVLPAGVTFDHASSGDYNASSGVWTVGDLSANHFKQLFIWVTVNAHLMSPFYTNNAIISGNEYDLNLSNNEDNETIYSPTVDIVVSKSVNDTTPNYRDLVTFTVTARNDGPSDATGVVLADLLPSGLVLLSANGSTGSYNNVTGVWTIGNLADGATATLTLVAQIMDSNKTITNTAVLTAVDQYESNPLSNGALVDLVIPAAADIQVTKTTNNTNPWVAENFLWTITVFNNGPNDATGVQIFDLLPAGLKLVSAVASQGTYNNATGIWSIGTLLNGSTATLAFVVNAMDSMSGVKVTNTATKSAENQYDWNTSNDVSSSSITVPAKKTFTLSVKNTGTGRIKAVYYVTVYQPGNAAAILKKYVFYLNPGKSASFTVGTYAVGTAVSTDEFVYNVASSKRTVSLVNTWKATGLAAYVQNFVVTKVPVSYSKGAHAMKRFWINLNTLDVFIVSPPSLL